MLLLVLTALLTASAVRAQQGDVTSLTYLENGTGPVATFTATDPEGVTPITWSLATVEQVTANDDLEDADNVDLAHFDISDDGVLTFDIGGDEDTPDKNEPPDFEDPQSTNAVENTYHVVVVASDAASGGQMGYRKVVVLVTDVEEPGKVTWTVDHDTDTYDADTYDAAVEADTPTLLQFQVGAILTASATDGDVVGATKTVTDATWQWYRSSSKTSTGAAIDGETSATYVVDADDVGKYLRVQATYRVEGSLPETASLVSGYQVLRTAATSVVPKFAQTDVARRVAEGEKGMNVGARVTATGGHGALNYTLTGTDATQFEIDQKTGQIKTKVDLNYEADAGTDNNCTAKNSCEVTVTATDSAGGASDPAAEVSITLNNVDEKPEFNSGYKMASVVEGTTVVDTDADDNDDSTTGDSVYEATNPEGGSVELTLMGADRNRFKLSDAGVLSFATKPDYDMPEDANEDNVYEVTVRASDGKLHADRAVKVTVTNMNEAPKIIEGGLAISGAPSMDYAENGTGPVATFTATGPMKDMAKWTLEGADSMYFNLGTTMGAMTELRFGSAPDYEMPRGMVKSDDNSNTYMVTLKANDGTYMDTHDVTVVVNDVEEMGVVELLPMNPVVGTEITAALTDPDGTDGQSWQWSRSMMMDGAFADISGGGATTASYTPVGADDGYYLKAKVMYTDAHGPQMAEATTTMAVTSNRPPAFADATDAREVEENTAAGMSVGDPVTATDPDGDTLTYDLGGTDKDSFDIDSETGQIMTKVALDYETKMSYMVTVTATDPDGESDSIEVTINVTNVDEGPVANYDHNKDGSISITELFSAIDDYFAGDLSVTELFEVIDAYFSG